MKTTTGYKLINWDTNETIAISLFFSGLADRHLANRTIKAYPTYEQTTISELQGLVEGSNGYIDFILEQDNS